MEHKINQIEIQNQSPKKRVLFIITQSEMGGAQKFVYETVTRINKEKYELTVAAGPNYKAPTITYTLLDLLNKEGVKTLKLKNLRRQINPWHDFLALFEVRKIIKSFKPEVLFLCSSKAGVLGSFVSKYLMFNPKPKVIYRIGGWSFNDPWPSGMKKLFILIERLTAKSKDVIVVNNKSDFEQAVRLKIKPRGEIKLIYNGIDALKIEFLPKEEARLKLKVSQADFIIGAVANFYPTKGLEYLIEAGRILSLRNRNLKFKILIIGDGQERAKLESKISDYNLKQKILILGRLPQAYKYLKAFDAFIQPSLKEGFSWVILEAISAKVPIIATPAGIIPEIIESGKNGILVEPKNPKQIAEAIEYFLKNEMIRQELAIQAHQTILFKFPIEKMVRETEELFD